MTCPKCLAQHGMAYPVSSAVVGENYPPFHPNCKCKAQPYEYSDRVKVGGGAVTPFENPAFGPDPDDWMFFGRNGDEFNETPEELYTDEAFGKPIKPEKHEELHVVDWIARILFHETGELETQTAILWCIMNRYLNKEIFNSERDYYTYGQENTLVNILGADGAYEVFVADAENTAGQNASDPLAWIEQNPTFAANGNSTMVAWKNAISLAKRYPVDNMTPWYEYVYSWYK